MELKIAYKVTDSVCPNDTLPKEYLIYRLRFKSELFPSKFTVIAAAISRDYDYRKMPPDEVFDEGQLHLSCVSPPIHHGHYDSPVPGPQDSGDVGHLVFKHHHLGDHREIQLNVELCASSPQHPNRGLERAMVQMLFKHYPHSSTIIIMEECVIMTEEEWSEFGEWELVNDRM